MNPCIGQVTTLPSAFDADLRDYSRVGCHAIEVWLTKLESFLANRSVSEVRALMQTNDIKFVAASVQGGILLTQGDARNESFSLFRRRLELCRELDIRTLVVVVDFVESGTWADFERAVSSLKEAAQLASQFSVRLALEFQGRGRFCNNLSTAAALVAHAAEPNVGLCLDVFHYYTGPSKFEDLALVSSENLFHVQVSDLAGIPRELATDSDRILPGDGDFQLQPIIDHLRNIGYADYVSVELMNPRIWQVPTLQTAEITLTALRALLGHTQSARAETHVGKRFVRN